MDGKIKKNIAITTCFLLLFFNLMVIMPSEKVEAGSYNGQDLAHAILANNSWLLSSSYTDTDNSGHRQAGVFSSLGTMLPTEGSDFALFSTGIAGADIVTTDGTEPGDERGSWFGAGQYGYPRDSATLTMELEVPEYMHYLYYDVQFFSTEYPDYIGTSYNDVFTVTVDSPSCGVSDYYFDVNSGYFTLDSDDIPGTGFDIYARSGYPSGVDWVDTTPRSGAADGGASDLIPVGGETHPVSPNEIITVTIDITDTGDNQFDSAAFIDNLMFTGFAKTEIIARKTVTDLNGGQAEPGDLLKYTISLINTGEADQNNNPGDEFEDLIPDNTEFVTGSETASNGMIQYNAGEDKITWNGAIPAESSVSLSFQVEVDPDLSSGTVISNQGTVNWDSNEDGTNDATELTDNPYIDDGIDQDGDGDTDDDDPTNITIIVFESPSTVTENFDSDTPGCKATEYQNLTQWFETTNGTTGSPFYVAENYYYQGSESQSFKTKLRNSGNTQYWNYSLDKFDNLTFWETWFKCGDASEAYNLTLTFKDDSDDEITKIKFGYANDGGKASLPLDWFLNLYYYDNGWNQLQSDYTGYYLRNDWYKLKIEKTGEDTLKYSLIRNGKGVIDVDYGTEITGSFNNLASVEFSSDETPIVCPMFFWDEHKLGFE
jgi:uncharacterized repeat protein (TIGR01451 family)